MSSVFQFKQFSVDQTGCAMKINTDGVLLGALAGADDPKAILDIGTGTGVIALMLAQRFVAAKIDAVEIDELAAKTAGMNFQRSPFADRLNIYPAPIANFFEGNSANRYDLIISNPPFHLNSLESPEPKRSTAKHTGETFFEELVNGIAKHLSETGTCWLILPLQAASLVKKITVKRGLCLQRVITLQSFKDSEPHREILVFGNKYTKLHQDKFVIYESPKVYTGMYKSTLADFFIIFDS